MPKAKTLFFDSFNDLNLAPIYKLQPMQIKT